MVNNVILLLGSNLGNRLQVINDAEEEIKKAIGKVIKRSKVYETASWGDTSLAPFLNQVIEVETELLPQEIMHKILQIEQSLGRKRTHKWESRVIDIDILFFENEVITTPELVIPHPYLHKRRFTLVPLVEIHASKVHPVFQKTCEKLLEELTDPLLVTEYKPLFAIK